MQYSFRAVLDITLLCVMSMPTVAPAQERPFTDLTDTEVTPAALAEALLPKIEPPPLSRSMKEPTCARFHQQISRGIRPTPVAENIALSVEFDSNSALLTSRARVVLDTLGQALLDPRLEKCCFQIEGHTDNENTEEYNQRLSEDRARSVATYLHENFGLDLDQLLQDSFGERRPLATNDTADGRRKNRRVQVTTLGYRTVEGGP